MIRNVISLAVTKRYREGSEKFMQLFDKMNASFIGAGKAGVTLGAYFRSKGIVIGGYASENMRSSLAAAKITGSRVFNNVAELVENSGIIFITTPDDAIESVWDQVSSCNIKGKFICHTSGSLTSAVFTGIKECGAWGYSAHPMYAFADKDGNFDGLEKAYFTIEGDGKYLNEFRSVFSAIGSKTIVIDREKKTLYHISNVMVSNLVLALVSIGCECLEDCGISSEDSLNALLPLINCNVKNISEKGVINSLTGPAERNDTGTVQKHLGALPEKYKQMYNVLTRRILELSGMKHPDRDYSELLKLIK